MLRVEDDSSFRKALVTSGVAHGVIAILAVVRLAFFPDDNLIFQSAVRVDLVALPDKILDAPAEVPTEGEKTPTPSPPVAKPKDQAPEVDLKPKLSQKKIIAKLKALEALERMEKEEKAKTVKPTFKGNQIAEGSDLRGLAKLNHDDYVARVERHIKSQWFRPEWMRNKNFVTQILVKFDDAGRILGAQITRSSGNGQYDEIALETVRNASPVPAPPDRFRDLFKHRGVVFIFGDLKAE